MKAAAGYPVKLPAFPNDSFFGTPLDHFRGYTPGGSAEWRSEARPFRRYGFPLTRPRVVAVFGSLRVDGGGVAVTDALLDPIDGLYEPIWNPGGFWVTANAAIAGAGGGFAGGNTGLPLDVDGDGNYDFTQRGYGELHLVYVGRSWEWGVNLIFNKANSDPTPPGNVNWFVGANGTVYYDPSLLLPATAAFEAAVNEYAYFGGLCIEYTETLSSGNLFFGFPTLEDRVRLVMGAAADNFTFIQIPMSGGDAPSDSDYRAAYDAGGAACGDWLGLNITP